MFCILTKLFDHIQYETLDFPPGIYLVSFLFSDKPEWINRDLQRAYIYI